MQVKVFTLPYREAKGGFDDEPLRAFDVFSAKRYEVAIGLLLEIGGMLGNWIKQQQARA